MPRSVRGGTGLRGPDGTDSTGTHMRYCHANNVTCMCSRDSSILSHQGMYVSIEMRA